MCDCPDGGLQSITRELGSALGVAVVGTVVAKAFAGNLPIALGSHRPAPHTVAEALSASTADRAAILDAFARGAVTGLHWAAVVTLVAGVAVTAVATKAARR